MSTSRRSTTGCSLCKARRKKCDETKPQCQRCLALGIACTYDYVEYSVAEGYRTRRTKPGSRITASLATASQAAPVNNLRAETAPFIESIFPRSSDVLAHSTWTRYDNTNRFTSGLAQDYGATSSLYPQPAPLAPSQPLPGYFTAESSNISLGFVESTMGTPIASTRSGLVSQELIGSQYDNSNIDEGDDSRPKELQTTLYITPTMDKNVKENTLPFVLQCYSQWATSKIFEPLKVINGMRDHVIQQFSSEDSRTRTILIANVMIDLGINSKLDNKRVTILASLDVEIRKKSRGFISTPVSSVPQLDRQTALATMNGMFEILALQAQTRPFAVGLRLLDDIAPVFRRACPESPGERVNLPNILLNPDFNLRNFAASDIMISVTTGQPTYLQYEVPFSLDLCERMSQAKSENGLQSIYGIPNEFIMLFAWINSLCEEPGAGQNLGLVSWIEDNLWKIKIADDQSSDPLLRIGRMAVQECWRFAVIAYLYMALCEADSFDPRVIRAQKGYMRLVRGIKPGRYPDAYLVNSMIVVGIAIMEERDRETLRQRMYKVWEWMEPGTTGNDAIMRLEDIWTRTRVERRPAVWADLRIASRKVLGR